VNDQPHIGHSYTTILADVLSRYHRLFGDEVRFQTGTDEHGQKVQQAAQARGVSPQQNCDEFYERFREMWDLLEIKYDRFIRTTDTDHKQRVQEFLQILYDKGDIYRATYEGWYNVSDEMFISDSEVTDEGKESGRIIRFAEDNYFFRMTRYADWLRQYLSEENPTFILPESRRNEILGLLRQPVNDLCISRPKSRLAWGIELPFDKDYVTYVWVDALTNYITGLGWHDSGEFTKWWPHCLHLIGKDILKPHGFFWPILLQAAGVELPKRILAHGWWTRGGQKESKTVTKALAAQVPVRHIRELVAEYGVDQIRYYLIREMTLGMDQDYSEEMIVQRLNSDLANDLGNLVSRVTKLIRQHFEGKMPAADHPEALTPSAKSLAEQCAQLPTEVQRLVDDLKPNSAVDQVLSLIRAINTYIAECEPWILVKKGQKEAAGHCLALSLRCLRVAAILLQPVMPKKMEALLTQIGCPVTGQEALLLMLNNGDSPTTGTEIPGGEPLFPRIDWNEICKKIEAPQDEVHPATPLYPLVSIDAFRQTDLRVARVLEAERVLKADKLLRLKISLGTEERQIVAGVAEFYSPEEMLGKQIIVVANLQPAKIRGLESKGMLLAARDGNRLRLVTLEGEGIGEGAKVS
jgi:methionyl-tRNA synthetase